MSPSGLRVACKRESLVVSRVGDGEEIYAFDHAGRLFAAWRGGWFYRRGLNGRVLEQRTERTGRHRVRHRRLLEEAEARALVDAGAAVAARAKAALAGSDVELVWSLPGPPDPAVTAQLLDRARAFDADAADADRRRFEDVYAPVPILPPDRYLALVLQITEGCHWNRCTFCSFYRDRPFRVKSLDEFAEHVERVIAYFGPGLNLRRGVFLGDANALLLPAQDLAARLDVVARALPDRARDLSGFIDVFTGHRRTVRDLAQLAQRGLHRVYLGLESGDDELLAFLNKPQRAADAVTLVQALHAAGIAAGVIVMAGIGGVRYRDRHRSATARTLEAMQLRGDDLVYVSAFEAPAAGPYADRAAVSGVAALSTDEVADEVAALTAAIRHVVGPGVRVAPYEVAQFIY